jgi:hypothetical protein
LFDNFEATSQRAEFAERIVRPVSLSDRCNALIAFYSHAKAEIMAAGPAWGIDPYEVQWSAVFTPIEAEIWHELRRANLAFYPQLPVGRAFVDFGNPHHKIAIECDGKEFHLDRMKDRERDAALAARGWRTYRITGADCMADPDEDDYEAGPRPARLFVLEIARLMGRDTKEKAA